MIYKLFIKIDNIINKIKNFLFKIVERNKRLFTEKDGWPLAHKNVHHHLLLGKSK